MPAAASESGDVRAARDVVARLNDPETGGRYERWVERVRGCSRPVRLRGASHEADAATGELVREFASEREPDGVQLTPCGNRRAHVCPACSEVYRGRRVAGRGVGAARRQGRAGVGGGASAGVRDLHRAELRPGAHDPRGRRQAAGVPSAPQGRDVPARPLAVLRQVPRRGRPVPRRGDLPGLLQLRALRAVEPQRGPPVQAHAHLRRARARPPSRPDAEGGAPAGPCVLRQGGGVPAPRRGALPHALAPRCPR
jgi:Replication initiator protein, pSAM2